MRARSFAALLSTLALAACGGGGGGSSSPAPVPAAPTAAPSTPQGTATVPMSISIPRRTGSAGRSIASARAPQYVSPSTESFALYDGTTLIYVANV